MLKVFAKVRTSVNCAGSIFHLIGDISKVKRAVRLVETA